MPSLPELLSLIDLLYEGALDETHWQAAITSVCRAFGGNSALLSLHVIQSEGLETVAYVVTDPALQRRKYASLIAQPDMSATWAVIKGCVASGAATAAIVAHGAPNLERTRFHEEWLRPLAIADFILAPLAPSATRIGGLFVGRSRSCSAYREDDVDAMRLLQPHLSRACQIRERLARHEVGSHDALVALDRLDQAVMLADAQGVVLHANSAATVMLGRCDGLHAMRLLLTCDFADDSSALRRLVAGTASAGDPGSSGGMLAVRRRSGRRPLSVLVAPLRGEPFIPAAASAVLFVSDPESGVTAPSAHLRQLYGLTDAEARVAEAVLDCDRLADIASRLGVSLHTVRTLLQRAFDKTDTHSQAELVRLIMAHRLPTIRNGHDSGTASLDAVRTQANGAQKP